MKIAVTGLISSGKSTAANFLSQGKYPIYSADKEVAKLYKNNLFKKSIASSFKLKNNKDLKKNLKELILKNEKNLNKLEKIIHPKVRKKMKQFLPLPDFIKSQLNLLLNEMISLQIFSYTTVKNLRFLYLDLPIKLIKHNYQHW